MNRNDLFKLAVFAVILGFVVEFMMFSRQAKACGQEILIIDGRVVVCTACAGTVICN